MKRFPTSLEPHGYGSCYRRAGRVLEKKSRNVRAPGAR